MIDVQFCKILRDKNFNYIDPFTMQELMNTVLCEDTTEYLVKTSSESEDPWEYMDNNLDRSDVVSYVTEKFEENEDLKSEIEDDIESIKKLVKSKDALKRLDDLMSKINDCFIL